MAASVQVLCPNGRRQNVKVTPNTKLLQILEEVCQRQGFIPPEDYKLIQGRKELDLSMSVRFSSLPNNAKLELAKSSSARVEQDVTIALQLDSGQRLQDSFKPSASLWDILLHLESKNSEYTGVLTRIDTSQTPALHPVCIYMREEVIGQAALLATSLKKLGLTSGKAIIRLLHRPVEDLVIGEIIDKIEKEKQKQAKLEELAIKKSELRQQDEQEKSLKSDCSLHSHAEEVKEQMETDEVQVSSVGHERGIQTTDTEPMEEVPQDSHTHSVSSPSPTDSSGAKSRSSRTSSKKAQPQSNSSQSNMQAQPSSVEDLRNLNLPGVEIFTPDDFNDLTPQEQAVARRLAQRILPSLFADTSVDTGRDSQVAQSQPQPHTSEMPFADFKFPEATRGMDLTSSQSDELLEAITPECDREPVLYDAQEPISTTDASSEDIPDDFFEVTQADVRNMYRDLQNSLRNMEEQPLLTKAMRQSQTEALFDQYSCIVIRVQFPDRLVLQGLFKPREPVAALYAFVKQHLHNSREKFYLYTAPPKEILRDKRSSLAANRLAPAALVYFGSESQRDHHLGDKIRSKITRRLEAEAVVTKVLKPPLETDTGIDTTTDPDGASTSQAGTSRDVDRRAAASRTTASFSSSTSSRVPSSGQMPKWLKLGKK